MAKAYPLIECDWLLGFLDRPELILLDVSMKPATAKGGLDESPVYIPGARIFSIKEEFSDLESGYPNTLPSPEAFEAGCQRLGINQDSVIIVYDNEGIYSSPRAWWMFKTMGHEWVQVLDGGLPEWKRLGFPVVEAPLTDIKPGDFKAGFQSKNVISYEMVKANVTTQERLVIDARAAERFQSLVDEPRAGVPRGNIPDSINLPFTEVLKDGKFKSLEEIREIIFNVPWNEKFPIFSCASGVTACIILMARELCFSEDKAIFDGSWTEWALREM